MAKFTHVMLKVSCGGNQYAGKCLSCNALYSDDWVKYCPCCGCPLSNPVNGGEPVYTKQDARDMVYYIPDKDFNLRYVISGLNENANTISYAYYYGSAIEIYRKYKEISSRKDANRTKLTVEKFVNGEWTILASYLCRDNPSLPS